MRDALDRVSWPARRWLADRLVGRHAYSRNVARTPCEWLNGSFETLHSHSRDVGRMLVEMQRAEQARQRRGDPGRAQAFSWRSGGYEPLRRRLADDHIFDQESA